MNLKLRYTIVSKCSLNYVSYVKKQHHNDYPCKKVASSSTNDYNDEVGPTLTDKYLMK